MMTISAFFGVIFKSMKNTSRKNSKTGETNWLVVLIMMILNFLSLKRIIVGLNRRIGSALMHFVRKMVWFIQSIIG